MDWTNVCSLVRPEILLNSGYIIALHENLKDVMLFREGTDDGYSSEVLATKHVSEVTSFVFITNHKLLLTCAKDATVYVWKLSESFTFDCMDEIHLESAAIKMCEHPKHKMVVFLLEGNTIILRHLANANVDEVKIQVKDSNVTCLAQTENSIVYGTDKGTMYIWRYEENRKDLVSSICVSPTEVEHMDVREKFAVTWGKNQLLVKVWDITSCTLLTDIDTTCDLVDVILSLDSSHVITATKNGDIISHDCKTTAKHCIRQTSKAAARLAIDQNNVLCVLEDGSCEKIPCANISDQSGETRRPSQTSHVNAKGNAVSGEDTTSLASTSSSSSCNLI